MPRRSIRTTSLVLLTAAGLAAGTATVAAQSGVTYIRPGAPGEPSQVIDPPAINPDYTDADVMFMRHMLPHHGQALLMSEWALGHEQGERGDPTEAARAEDERVQTLAWRIHFAQSHEINFMVDWLERRSLRVPDHRTGIHHDHDMPGMVSPEDLEELESLQGHEFDVRFLELMIPHHQGAITMVHDLEDNGGGFEANISALASQIEADQRAEIGRMQALLADLTDG